MFNQFYKSVQVHISREDMLRLLKTDEALVKLDTLDACQKIRDNLGKGGCIVLYVTEEDPVCAWVGF